MQIQDKPASQETTPVIEVGTYHEPFYQDAQATFVVPKAPPHRHIRRALVSPIGVLFLSCLLMVALVSFGMGASISAGSTNNAPTSGTTTSSSSSSSMNMSASQPAPSNVPNATQEYGGQFATSTLDPDGAKHFTFTAKQVMWEVVKGQRVLAWTLNGTVPGPTIRVTAGDHLRITIINHFPKPTAIHWHGLEVPSSADGVPGIGMQPIQPGQTYTYDFTVTNDDIGTHWYHSHYDDLEQDGGGDSMAPSSLIHIQERPRRLRPSKRMSSITSLSACWGPTT